MQSSQPEQADRNAKAAAKPLQIHDLYQEHHFIDARDTEGEWRVGYILQKNEKSRIYKVRFDGWAPKWDEYYYYSSSKLRHFRTVTIGYTGQKTYMASRPTWKFDAKQHAQKFAELNAFMEVQTRPSSAFGITQFLRGSHYIYTDFLLGWTYQDIEDFKSVIKYCQTHFDLTKMYIDDIDTSFRKYYRSLEIKEQSIVVDAESAYVHAFYEIFDSCIEILGGVTRLQSFFKDNKAHLQSLVPNALETEVGMEYYIQKFFISYFEESGAWISLKNLVNKLKDEKGIIPYTFLKVLTNLFVLLDKYVQKDSKKKTSENLLQIFRNNFDRITDKQIKDLDRVLISDVVTQLKNLFLKSPDRERIGVALENCEIETSLKFFRSPYFEKKLKGITSLKEILDLISKGKEYLSAEDYFNWAMKSGFLKEVFGDSIHVEFLKRATEILKLFCEKKLMNEDVVNLIWSARQGKHEAVVKTLDQLITELVYELPEELVQFLFDKIKAQPISSWDSDYLDLVKKYSQNAVRSGKAKLNKYGLDLIYEYATKKQDQKSLNAFFDLLTLPLFEDELAQYRDICIEKIKLGMSSYFHVCLFLKIEKEPQVSLTAKQNLVDILVLDILRESKYVDQLQTRLSLLDTILYFHQSLTLQVKHFDKLWEEFKIKKHPGAQIFVNWLCRNEGRTYKINVVLDDAMKEYIFKEVLCNTNKNDFMEMDLNECQVFLCFMYDINLAQSRMVRVKSTSIVLVANPELIGLPQLWHIFLNNKKQAVVNKAANTICDLSYRTTSKLQGQLEHQLVVKLIQKCVDLISSGSKKQNLRLVSNCINLLLKLITKVEGKYVHNPANKPRFTNYQNINFVNTLTHEKKQIQFNVGMPFGCLRNEVSVCFERPVKGFQLTTKSGVVISSDLDSVPHFDCAIVQPINFTPVQIQENIVKVEMNKHLELLFSLLSTEVCNLAWQLLSQLPISSEFKENIEKAESWEELLSGGVYRELYLLRVIETMSSEEWAQFIVKGGIKSISKKLDHTLRLNTEVELDYLRVLTRLLHRYYGSQTGQPQTDSPTEKIRLVNALFDALYKLCQTLKVRFEDKSKKPLQGQAKLDIEREIGENIILIFQLFQKNDKVSVLKVILETGQLETVLCVSLIISQNIKFKQAVCYELVKLLLEAQKTEPSQTQQILVLSLTNVLNYAIQIGQHVTILFSFVTILIDKLNKIVICPTMERLTGFIEKIEELIKSVPAEPSSREKNDLMWGLLCLTRGLFSRKEIKKKTNDFWLLRYICEEYLMPEKGQIRSPKAKTASTRLVAFKLAETLMCLNETNFLWVIQFFSKFHVEGQWRTKRLADWIITPKMNEKSPTGYVGIKNLGCICYMNSFLQQTFMIPSFREAVFAVQDPQFQKTKPEENLLYQLKTLFVALEKSEQQYYNPRAFCHAFKDYEGKPINTSEQMDIDEFSGVMFDRLENQVKGAVKENFIKEHFGGVISNQIISKGCHHFSERQEPFLTIPLSIKNKKNIYASLQTMVKGEMLEGDNAYMCQKCNKKVPAVMRMCLKKLPNHLIIVLKRFEFNFDTMTKNKINDYCQFPTELNLMEYSHQYLRNKQKPNNADDDEQQYPPEYFNYQLKGVVVHMGFADSGHYYSYIQKRGSPTEDWFEFNDTIVRKFDPENLANQAFGGEERSYQANAKEKIRNAYVLIYDRKQSFNSSDHKLTETVVHANRDTTPYLAGFLKQLRLENELAALHQLLFAKQYQEFLTECITVGQKTPSPQCELEFNKFMVLFFLTRSIREKQKKAAYDIAAMLRNKILESPELSRWVLEVFSDPNVINEIFKNNPSKEMRKLIANILVSVCRVLFPAEGEGANNRLFETQDTPENPYPKTHLANFINVILKCLNEKFIAASNELMMILTKLSQFGCEIADYLLDKRIIVLLIQNLLQKDPAISFSGKLSLPFKPPQNLIGQAAQSEHKQSLFDLVAQRKQRMEQQKTYFWFLLSELLRHCDLKKKNEYPQYFYDTRHTLEKEQLSLIYFNSLLLYKYLEESRNKLAIRKIVKYIVLLAIEDTKISEQALKLISKALKALQSSKFRQFFVLFKQLIEIPDQLQMRRLQGVNEIKIGLDQNKKYYVEVDMIQQWLLKIARKNKKLRDHLVFYNAVVQGALAYIKDKQSPSEELARKNRPPCDKLVNVLHGLQLPKSSSAYIELSKIKTAQFTAIMNNEPYDSKLGCMDWDSDDDLAEKEVKVGESVNIYLEGIRYCYVQAKIQAENYEYLTLKLKDRDETVNIWKDDETVTTAHKIFCIDDMRQVEGLCSDETGSIENEQEIDH